MLWIEDIFTDNPQRVVFGLKPSPFLLNGAVKHHISKYELEDPEFVDQFSASFFVDDLISGMEQFQIEAFQFYLNPILGSFSTRWNFPRGMIFSFVF